MLEKGSSQVEWRLRGNIGFVPIDVSLKSTFILDLITGRVKEHNEEWDLSRWDTFCIETPVLDWLYQLIFESMPAIPCNAFQIFRYFEGSYFHDVSSYWLKDSAWCRQYTMWLHCTVPFVLCLDHEPSKFCPKLQKTHCTGKKLCPSLASKFRPGKCFELIRQFFQAERWHMLSRIFSGSVCKNPILHSLRAHN